VRRVRATSEFGEVAERSNATDCKSVALAASEVRILPSPPFSSGRNRRHGVAGLYATAAGAAKAGVTQW
jgi:hypothetical protein